MRILKFFGSLIHGLLLGACSMHPLQDDVTGLSLSEVVHKVRCEAKDAVSRVVAEENWIESKKKFLQIQQEISVKKNLLQPFAREDKFLSERRAALIDRRNALLNEIRIIQALNQEPAPPGLVARFARYEINERRYYEALSAFLSDQRLYQQNRQAIDKQVKNLEEKISADPSLKSIVAFYGNTFAYDFRFQITETNSLSSTSSTYKFPIHLGSITLGLDASDIKDRVGERNAKLTINFRELDAMDCSERPQEQYGVKAVHYPIVGNLGLHEVVSEYVDLLKLGKLAKLSPYTDQIVFTTTLSGGLNPSILLTPVPLEQISANLKLSGTRKDLHSVTINITPPSPPEEEKPTRVLIVTEPNLFFK